MPRTAWAIGAALLAACSTSGSAWIEQSLHESEEDFAASTFVEPEGRRSQPDLKRYRVRSIGGQVERAEIRARRIEGERLQGRVLGRFRNTYYDFPSEQAFPGERVAVHNASCEVIKQVPLAFYEALCVQGSGLLDTGQTVSFSRRNCECARTCTRTNQKICFDALEQSQFPWGRGALGKPITPLLTVAVDDKVVPMGTALYIPEYDGLPRDPSGSARHDGCFLAQDRGTKVVGQHVDVFTGQADITLMWNRLVPSNQGVTVVLESPRCARAAP